MKTSTMIGLGVAGVAVSVIFLGRKAHAAGPAGSAGTAIPSKLIPSSANPVGLPVGISVFGPAPFGPAFTRSDGQAIMVALPYVTPANQWVAINRLRADGSINESFQSSSIWEGLLGYAYVHAQYGWSAPLPNTVLRPGNDGIWRLYLSNTTPLQTPIWPPVVSGPSGQSFFSQVSSTVAQVGQVVGDVVSTVSTVAAIF